MAILWVKVSHEKCIDMISIVIKVNEAHKSIILYAASFLEIITSDLGQRPDGIGKWSKNYIYIII